MTNTKAFLAAGTGFNSWNGEMEIIGYESYDAALSLESLASWFYMEKLLAVCR
jgi:hypothetical protein